MAYKVFQRSFTAGVALAGVGAITFATVSVLPPEPTTVVAAPAALVAGPRVVTTEILPTASIAEILFNGATATFQESWDALVNGIPELLWTVNADWPDDALTGRNYSRVADMVLLPIMPFVVGSFTHAVTDALAQTFPQFSAQIDDIPAFVEYLAARVIGPFVSAFAGAGEAHAGIFRTMLTWDIPGFVVAVLKAPLYVIDGFLNGGYGDISPLLPSTNGELTAPPGLLTPWGSWPTPRNIDGPVETESTDVDADTAVESTVVSDISDGPVDLTVDAVSAETVTAEPEPTEDEVLDSAEGDETDVVEDTEVAEDEADDVESVDDEAESDAPSDDTDASDASDDTTNTPAESSSSDSAGTTESSSDS